MDAVGYSEDEIREVIRYLKKVSEKERKRKTKTY